MAGPAKRSVKSASGLAALSVPLDTAPMEAKSAGALPEGEGWQYEPKWDGFRCLAFRAGDEVELRAKSGKPLTRYFPEVADMLRALKPDRFVIDGELAVPAGRTLSFDALQMRLHPAESRIRKLSAETPAVFILFDMLMAPDGTNLMDAPLSARRAALEKFHKAAKGPDALRLSPCTSDVKAARRWLAGVGGRKAGGTVDGVIAKRADGPYLSGERAMVKVKRLRTADCVVGGFRYGTNSRHVGSLLLGLYDAGGLLHHVGFTTPPPKARAALTPKLEALVRPPGFTGGAPGGPSRWSSERSAEWSPLKPELVVEVRYDHVTGGRFRHGAKLLRWRPDKAPHQCTFEQIEK